MLWHSPECVTESKVHTFSAAVKTCSVCMCGALNKCKGIVCTVCVQPVPSHTLQEQCSCNVYEVTLTDLQQGRMKNFTSNRLVGSFHQDASGKCKDLYVSASLWPPSNDARRSNNAAVHANTLPRALRHAELNCFSKADGGGAGSGRWVCFKAREPI